jgi:hypothetical protein
MFATALGLRQLLFQLGRLSCVCKLGLVSRILRHLCADLCDEW